MTPRQEPPLDGTRTLPGLTGGRPVPERVDDLDQAALRGLSPREVLLLRQAGVCWWCLTPITDASGAGCAEHHRKSRKHPDAERVSNKVLLHHVCHNLGTGSVHLNVAEARRRGFIVPSWGDPAETPLVTATGVTLLLTDDGGVHYTHKERDHEW